MNRPTRKFALLLSCAALVQLLTAPAFAAIPGYDKKIDYTRAYGESFDMLKVQVVRPMNSISYEDVSRMIPTDMTPTSSGGSVASRILDFSLNNWLKSPTLKNHSMVRAAAALDNAVETDVSFGGSKEGDIKHNVKMKLKPLQATACLDYSGIVNAKVSFQAGSEKMDFEVSEEVAAATTLVFNHSFQKGESTDTVNLRWTF